MHGHVLGEHGDGAVVCASSTTINGRPVVIPTDRIRVELAARSGLITVGVGRTGSGPAGAVLSALRKTLALTDGIEELSTAHHGGWLGIPLRFTGGQPRPCLPEQELQLTDCLKQGRPAQPVWVQALQRDERVRDRDQTYVITPAPPRAPLVTQPQARP